MVVLIDTNVIIDFLVAREPFYDSALCVMEKCASGEADGYMAFHSLPNLWYFLRKVPVETRRLWLKKSTKQNTPLLCINLIVRKIRTVMSQEV